VTQIGDSIKGLADRPFARFAVAGACGFATDAAVLSVLVHNLHMDPHQARFFSFACALAVTWTINRLWTFADAEPRKRRLPLYVGVQIAGAVLNNVDLERTYNKDYFHAGAYYYVEDDERKTRKRRLESKANVG